MAVLGGRVNLVLLLGELERVLSDVELLVLDALQVLVDEGR